MLAAAAMSGEWTNEIPHDHILAKVFVHDRLKLSNNNRKLQDAFHALLNGRLFLDKPALSLQASADAVAISCADGTVGVWGCKSADGPCEQHVRSSSEVRPKPKTPKPLSP